MYQVKRMMSTQRSLKKPIFLGIGSTALTFATVAYIATKNEQVRKVWIDTVPGGQDILELVIKTEQSIKEFDVEGAKQKASDLVTQTEQEINTLKQTSKEKVDRLKNTVKGIQESVEDGIDKTFQTIHDTTRTVQESFTSTKGAVKDSIAKTTDVVVGGVTKVQEGINTTVNVVKGGIDTVQEGYHQVEGAIKGVVKGVEGTVDSVKGVFGDEKKVRAVVAESPKENQVQATKKPVVVQQAVPVEPVKPEKNSVQEGKKELTPVPVIETSTEPQTKVKEDVSKVAESDNGAEKALPEVGEETKDSTPLSKSAPSKSTLHNKDNISNEPVAEPISKPLEVPSTPIATDLSVNSNKSSILPTLMNEMAKLSNRLLSLAEQGTNSIQTPQMKQELIGTAEHLNGLAGFLEYLQADEISLLAVALQEQAESFYKEMMDCKAEAEQRITDIQSQLNSAFEAKVTEERMKVQKESQDLLVLKLQEQSEQFKEALTNALKEQSDELERVWNDEVKKRVDGERKGRLARLEHLALKLKQLERMSLDTNEFVHRSSHLFELQSCVKALKMKLFSKFPNIKSELSKLREVGREDPLVVTVLQSMENIDHDPALVSVDELYAQFLKLKPVLLKNQLLPNEAGPITYLLSHLLSQFMILKAGLVPGNDTLAILSRVEYHLQHRNVTDAVLEMNKLKGWTRLLADDWLKYGRGFLKVQQAVDVIETRLGLVSLGYLQ